MPSSSSGGRDSRRSSKSGASAAAASSSGSNDAHKGSGDRREKAKSSQSYTAAYNAARRGSVQPSHEGGLGSVPERPRLKTRTHSAPLVEVRQRPAGGGPDRDGGGHTDSKPQSKAKELAPQTSGGAMADGQDEDEVAGAVGSARLYEPFSSPEVGRIVPGMMHNMTGIEAESCRQCRSRSLYQKSTSL